ncbi:MAG: DEAD/DEAH box helicase, partial [Planctomycetes bacterium]|nr:DEAD/DEAH box helicase [Planctomycetota bacterium]
EKVVVARETATRFRVTLVKPVHWQIQRILGAEGMSFPAAALEQVKTVVGKRCAFLTVQSEVGGVAAEARELALDARLRAQLTPQQDGLRLDFFVAPLGDGGPYRRPGYGGAHLYHVVDGVNCHVERHLENEVKALEEAIAACPALGHGERTDSGGWRLDDAIDCLELLLQLQELGDRVVLEWPEGGRRRVERALSPSALSVRVARKNDWFELSGTVKVNEELTLSMQELLRLAASATGRFVRLSADQYLALTDSFKRRLDDLAAYGDVDGDGVRLSPLAALAVQDLAGEAGEFAADVAWKQQVARLSAPEDVPVPAGLQAELRDYQLAGFKWMANLAAWGLGACLADDMGLGKTVQTLALLLHRAEAGPALVVAPTSVCFNWAQEGARFAPALRFSRFEGEKDERAALVAGAGKGDVVVCSYAMLQLEEDLLTGREWATVALDEAQAIKNAATKRSQAAKKLNAGFRLVTTGTPIENHLGELWNLFNFLNPRLLGSHQRFQERFAIPIEKEEDAEARGRLRRLLRPFILRRVKADVLTELPSRTEIEKTVPMSEEELAFYEALRREAVARLSQPAAPREQRNFRILAEIMRLRRACCNPRLVAPDSAIESSKLAEFGRIVDDLRENGHRALVFSQFVDHLSLVREYLDGRGVSYQYLDGATPERNRRRVVKDFQDGQGDLFLISLKAGGLGLNLTAADYVIHLDPWWNPAVEDQASDRAHRIGQTRPVTIYRLVMADSIEAKIVELHRRKRDLAESLLGDNDLGGRLNPEELLKLIRDGD